MKIITKKSLDQLSSEPLHPLLLKVITRIVKLGAGIVHITPDHHVFVKLATGISELRGALCRALLSMDATLPTTQGTVLRVCGVAAVSVRQSFPPKA